MAHDDQHCWIFHTAMTICDEKPTAANPIGPPPVGGPVQGKLYYTYALQAFVSWTIARAVLRGTYTEETLWS